MITEINQKTSQGSLEWMAWRENGIGSSDVAAIFNLSPWKTRHQLWLEKTKKKESSFAGNSATQRGQDLEAKARALYEIHKGSEAPPCLIMSDEHEFMRCSLDGWDKANKRIVEIKCPGKPAVELAKAGLAPEYYNLQMQYQLMLSSAEACDYVVFDGKKIIVIEIKPDPKKQEEIFREVTKFWEMVLNDVEPALSEKDYKEFDDIKTLTYLAEINMIIKKKKELEAREKHLREKVIENMDHPKMFGSGLKVIRIERPGVVDWKKAQIDFDINPEEYRKPGSVSYQFRLEGDDPGGE